MPELDVEILAQVKYGCTLGMFGEGKICELEVASDEVAQQLPSAPSAFRRGLLFEALHSSQPASLNTSLAILSLQNLTQTQGLGTNASMSDLFGIVFPPEHHHLAA